MIEVLHYFTRMLQKLHIGALVEKRVRKPEHPREPR